MTSFDLGYQHGGRILSNREKKALLVAAGLDPLHLAQFTCGQAQAVRDRSEQRIRTQAARLTSLATMRSEYQAMDAMLKQQAESRRQARFGTIKSAAERVERFIVGNGWGIHDVYGSVSGSRYFVAFSLDGRRLKIRVSDHRLRKANTPVDVNLIIRSGVADFTPLQQALA